MPNDISYLIANGDDIAEYYHTWCDSYGTGYYRENGGPVIVAFRSDGTVIQETYDCNIHFNGPDDPTLPIEFEYYPNGNPKRKCYVGKRTHYYENGKEKHTEVCDNGDIINTLFNLDGSIFAKYTIEDLNKDRYNLMYLE